MSHSLEFGKQVCTLADLAAVVADAGVAVAADAMLCITEGGGFAQHLDGQTLLICHRGEVG
jgi:hypothetical protein